MHKVLFFSLTMLTLYLSGSQDNVQTNRQKPTYAFIVKCINRYYSSRQSQKTTPTPNYFMPTILPTEMQLTIIDFYTNKTTTKTPQEACKEIRNLIVVNRHLEKLINNPLFTQRLINDLSLKYCCSHESIAQLLQTKQSTIQFQSQAELKNICYPIKQKKIATITDRLNVLKNINFNFTYNNRDYQATALMMAISYNNKPLFKKLIEHKADPHATNASGNSILHHTVRLKSKNHTCDFLNNILTIIPQININQRNKEGETPLLYLLRCTKKKPHEISEIVKQLIDNGADVTTADKKGNTPLIIAKNLKNEAIINYIQQELDRIAT